MPAITYPRTLDISSGAGYLQAIPYNKATMKFTDIPFSITDWSTIQPSEHPGASGKAHWRTFAAGNVRVRLVEPSLYAPA